MDDLYRQYILEHFREPRNAGRIEHRHQRGDTNPLCGDRVEIELACKTGACGGALLRSRLRHQPGRGLDADREHRRRDPRRAARPTPDDILEMLGVEIGPARQRCALLSLRVLHQGIGGPYTGRMDEDELE